MLKKCLIALTLIAICGVPAMADPIWGWGATTSVAWAWDAHPSIEIPVKMKVVRWAELYFDNGEADDELVLVQIAAGQFEGFVDVKLCANFPFVKIDVQFNEIANGNDGISNSYRISIAARGTKDYGDASNSPVDSMTTGDQIYLTGANLPLTICLEANGVDKQAMAYTDGSLVQVGTIITTLIPTTMPTGVGSGGSYHTTVDSNGQ